MSILFYTINHHAPFFVVTGQTSKGRHQGPHKEFLNTALQIADEDDVEAFKAYLIEVQGAFIDDRSRIEGPDSPGLAPAETQKYMLIYLPGSMPALFAIEEDRHDALARLNISDYERYLPLVRELFHNQIEAEDYPNLGPRPALDFDVL